MIIAIVGKEIKTREAKNLLLLLDIFAQMQA